MYYSCFPSLRINVAKLNGRSISDFLLQYSAVTGRYQESCSVGELVGRMSERASFLTILRNAFVQRNREVLKLPLANYGATAYSILQY